MERYCRNCGRKLKGGEKFCPRCGRKLSPGPAVPEYRKREKPDKRKKKWVAVGIVLAVLLLGAGGYVTIHFLTDGFWGKEEVLTVHFACGDGEAVCLGTPGNYMVGVEVVAVCTADVNGKPSVITGNNMSGYTAWSYDGESLQAAASYTEAEVQELNTSIWYINAGSTSGTEEKQIRDLWSQVRQTKESLGILTETEQAMTAYQFELLYNENTGYDTCAGEGYAPRFEYVYIDEDDIPELVVALDGIHAEAAYLYVYDQDAGTAVCLGQFGAYGSFSYSERNNLIQQYDGHMGVIQYHFGKIENGDYVALHDFVAEYGDYSYEETPVLCRVDGQEVTYAVYQQMLDAVTEGVTFTSAGYDTGTSVRDVMYEE